MLQRRFTHGTATERIHVGGAGGRVLGILHEGDSLAEGWGDNENVVGLLRIRQMRRPRT